MNLSKDLSMEAQRLIEELKKLDPSEPEYAVIAANIERLGAADKAVNRLQSPLHKIADNPALVGLFGNLAVLLVLMNFERSGVIASKGLMFLRPK